MKNNLFLLLLLSIATIILSYFSKEILNTDNLIISSLSERLTSNQIVEALGFKRKWEWLSYVAIPLFLLIKIIIISAVLDAGCFFFNQEIKYKKLFNIVVKAEFLFLLVIVFKTFWLFIFHQDYTLKDLQYFYPLSILNIIGYDSLQPWFIYPLQMLNVFEIIYWGILAFLLGKELNIGTDKGMGIVASSYGSGLLIWVVTIMFFTLNMS